ncbi:GNAT family N-acetyltransferase [Marinivivus vitaminiproducens]|uniref:GNAT family N-acetyltransferase n=1 Tax=Marinivivus vitaminiproducens TaxID=3035935 RepID=UPI0027AAC870|nr:GNAT family N-acetyltransferase [Geminicoccaceae bacterium SCSIO 64248]
MAPDCRTPRLLLRPLRTSDAPALAELANDWQVARMLARVPFPYTVDDALKHIVSQSGRADALEWGVFTDRLVGCVGVSDHLGYWYGRPYWGRGYATEAGEAAIGAFFASGDAPCLESGHFEDNAASRRVLDKLGFVPVGRSLQRSEARDADVAHIDMRLERAVWLERQAKAGSTEAS